MTLTFALSVRNFIDDVGAYAGFAAFLAVALFALLVFAQAREIKRLREWGADAHDRLGELERAVAAAQELARRALSGAQRAPQAPQATQAPRPVAGRGRPAGVPAQAAAGAQRVASTSAPVRPQLLPAAPAGVAGPALASATALIPLPGAPESTATTAPPPLQPARQVAAAAAAVGAGARERTVPPTGRPATPRGREAVDAAAHSNGHDDPPTELAERVAAPPPPRRAAPPPPRREPAARPAGRGPAARPQPATGANRSNGRGGQPQDASHGRRRLVGVLAVLAAVIVLVVVVVLVIGRGGSDSPSRAVRVEVPAGTSHRAARRRAATRTQARAPQAPPPSQTTVIVLNGTTTPGLANRVMGQLSAAGYQQGGTFNASDPNRSATVVEYREGAQAAAEGIANRLGLAPDAVSQMSPDTEQTACANENPCIANVVVTVGADRAQ
jgi:hypothetical protein